MRIQDFSQEGANLLFSQIVLKLLENEENWAKGGSGVDQPLIFLYTTCTETSYFAIAAVFLNCSHSTMTKNIDHYLFMILIS